MSPKPDQPTPPSLLQRLTEIVRWPWSAEPPPATTPNGHPCTDRRLMRLAYAALEALNDERLDEGKHLVDKMLKIYPDNIWSYELHDHYLSLARDLYEPESRLDKASYAHQSRRNLERMLALNPEDQEDVYFTHEISSLHYYLALHHFDACWDANSAPDAQAAQTACQQQLAAWTTNGRTNEHDALVAESFAAACASIVTAWAEASGRIPGADEKRARLNNKEWEFIDGKRWPWKAGPLPEASPQGLRSANPELMHLAYAVCEAVGRRRLSRAKRLVDTLINTYPDCIWGYELYDFYLTHTRNDYEPAGNIIDKHSWLQESIRNFECMLALNPEDKNGVYFEAEFDSLRYNLARRLSDANWEARSEQEARDLQAACLHHLDIWISDIRAQSHADHIEFAEREYACIKRNCAEVVAEWVNGERDGEDDGE